MLNNLLLFDPLAVLLTLFISFTGATLIKFSVNYMHASERPVWFTTKLLLLILGLLLFVISDHFMLITASLLLSNILFALLVGHISSCGASQTSKQKLLTFLTIPPFLLLISFGILYYLPKF